MRLKRSKSRTNGYGVVRIVRDSYSTKSGYTINNSWYDLQKAAMRRDNNQCVACRRLGKITTAVEVHHILPLNRGGRNLLSNLISLCISHHNSRHRHLTFRKK